MNKSSESSNVSNIRVCGVIASILLSLLLVFTLSGCGSSSGSGYSSSQSVYVGSWQGKGEVTDDDGFTYNQTVSLAISSDGQWQMSQNIKGRVLGLTDNTIQYAGTWESSGNNINLRIIQTTGNTSDAGKYFQGEYISQTGNLIIGSGIGTLTKVSQ